MRRIAEGRHRRLPSLRHYLKPSLKWCADVRQADGTLTRVRLSANRDASAMQLAAMMAEVEQERAGNVDPFKAHRKRPLSEHLLNWQASLKASGRAEDYIALKRSRMQAVLDGCGWVFAADMAADRLETFLLDLREKEKRSVQTSNDWLQAVRQFCRWMVANERDRARPVRAAQARQREARSTTPPGRVHAG